MLSGRNMGRKPAPPLPKFDNGNEIVFNEATEISQEAYDQLSKRPRVGGIFISEGAPLPAEERSKREEQAKRIRKLSATVKRIEPRLFMEVLQDFGTIEGLNAARQAELIARLEKIHKDYRL